MPRRIRRNNAQVLLRMKPAERDRLRAAIPHGSLNAVAIQLLMDYVGALEARDPLPPLPLEDPAV